MLPLKIQFIGTEMFSPLGKTVLQRSFHLKNGDISEQGLNLPLVSMYLYLFTLTVDDISICDK